MLDQIYQYCNTGNPIIKSMFNKILYTINQVLFHQINAWIVHGQLIDISEEFFIHRIDPSQENKEEDKKEENKNDQSMISSKSQFARQNDTSMGNASQMNTSVVNATMGIIKLKNALGYEDDEKEWNNLFTVRISMLPSYIPTYIAENILFIGKGVRVL